MRHYKKGRIKLVGVLRLTGLVASAEWENFVGGERSGEVEN